MSLLIYLHIVFNQKPVTCLSHLHDTWPRQGVLRVELFFQTPPEDYDLEQSYAKEYQNNYMHNRDDNDENALSTNQLSEVIKRKIFLLNLFFVCFLKQLPVAEISIYPSENSSLEESYPNMSINSSLIPPDNSLIDIMNDNPIEQSEDDDDEDESLFNFDWIKQLLIEEQHILEYSLEYGFLRLSPETRKRLNIEVLLVTLGKIFIFMIKTSNFSF
jgi:hypothetical protein